MKKLLFILLMVIPLVGHTPSRHKVTVTITYNSMTLQEAADLEKRVQGNHPKACTITIGVGKEDNTVTDFTLPYHGWLTDTTVMRDDRVMDNTIIQDTILMWQGNQFVPYIVGPEE